MNAASAAATASVNRDIVVIGASSGGIRALWSLLGALPPSLPAAVVVVVHMSPHDTSYLAETLQRQTELRVKTAEDGEPLRHGVVYVPVPDRHVLVTEEGLRLTRGPRESRCRPAVDALFRSAAVAFRSRVIGVVLTGHLDDGTAGLWAIKDRGGKALVQDPATAQAPSMPESALHAVDPDFVGDPPALANEIARLVVSPSVVKSVAMSGRQEIENRIAMEENGFQAGVMKLGPTSTYSCPRDLSHGFAATPDMPTRPVRSWQNWTSRSSGPYGRACARWRNASCCCARWPRLPPLQGRPT
ncbi:MAG: chemotaxis protein CheB [Rhizobacter sp.]|nr:chemotaxis protein CheB [Rhizobacter sp.]